MCLLRAVKHYVKYASILLGVFKHVFGKDQVIETLVQIILAIPLERGEKRLRKSIEESGSTMEGLEESDIESSENWPLHRKARQ